MSRNAARRFSVKPRVEQLEARLNPDAASYVNGLYAQVLHRSESQAELNYWLTQFQTPPSTTVASAFWYTAEHRGLQVDVYYQNFLHRSESAADRQYWLDRFATEGLGEVQVQLAFVTGQE